MGCGSSAEKGCQDTKPTTLPSPPPVSTPSHDVETFDLARFKPKSKAKILDANDYDLVSYLQEGGMGKVYMGQCKLTGQKVAMKFFGYTVAKPSMSDIEAEIEVMDFLNGTCGIINFFGIFLDDPAGYIENKNYRHAYPVIVMELVEGGELSQRICNQASVTEKYLAKVFMKVATILVELGKRRIIHRDIKLENIMLLNDDEDSPIKLIDFGLMVHIPEGSEAYANFTLKGTNGCFAPESIIDSVYSAQTDVWQAGCTLYSMLSGLAPYDPDKMYQITHGSYFEMTGVGWDRISDAAKDLVSRTLMKDPALRITAEEILRHPWIVSAAPDTSLGEEYAMRIKQLALRQKLRSFFLDHNIARSNMDRRDKIRQALPFLFEVMDGDDGVVGSEPDDDGGPQLVKRRQSSDEFTFKMKTLKRMIVGSWTQQNAARLKSENDLEAAYSDMQLHGRRPLDDGGGHSFDSDYSNSTTTDIFDTSLVVPVETTSKRRSGSLFRVRTRSCGPTVTIAAPPRNDLDNDLFQSHVESIQVDSISYQPGPEERQSQYRRTVSYNSKPSGKVFKRHSSSGTSADPVRVHGTKRGLSVLSSIYDGRVTGRGLSQLATSFDSMDVSDTNGLGGGRTSVSDEQYVLPSGEITYDTFIEVMVKCGLTELADLSVFHIFDIGNTGSINMKEFLLTMLAFKPAGSDTSPMVENDEDSAARLYFQIFDIEETGYISKEELKLAVSVLLDVENGIVVDQSAESASSTDDNWTPQEAASRLSSEDIVVVEMLPPIGETGPDGSGDTPLKLFMKAHTPLKPTRAVSDSTPTSVPEMEELFDIIDVNKRGRINFEEFKSFYHTVLHHSVRRVTAYQSSDVAPGASGKYRSPASDA